MHKSKEISCLVFAVAIAILMGSEILASDYHGQDQSFQYSIEWNDNKITFSKKPKETISKKKDWRLILSGKIYEPSRKFDSVSKIRATRKTPLDSALSHYSASCDKNWMLSEFAPNERYQTSIQNQEVFDRNCSIFRDVNKMLVSGEAQYKDYALVFVGFTTTTGKKLGTYNWTFKRIGNEWLFTNDLAENEDMSNVSYILSATDGEIRSTK